MPAAAAAAAPFTCDGNQVLPETNQPATTHVTWRAGAYVSDSAQES